MFSKETIKSVPPRKQPSQSCYRKNLSTESERKEFDPENDEVDLKLGKSKLTFENGLWNITEERTLLHSPSTKASNLQFDESSEKMQKLIEENNFLKLKIEVLLNIIAETKAEEEESENVKRE